jgi:hypothetical protein
VQHAGYVVRSLGKELWKQQVESQHNRHYLGKHNPPAVRKKYFAGDLPASYPQLVSTGTLCQPVDN